MEYQQLESEKYFRQHIKRRIRHATKLRNQKAMRGFVTLLAGFGLLPIAYLLGKNLPAWSSYVISNMEAMLQSFLGNGSPISRVFGL